MAPGLVPGTSTSARRARGSCRTRTVPASPRLAAATTGRRAARCRSFAPAFGQAPWMVSHSREKSLMGRPATCKDRLTGSVMRPQVWGCVGAWNLGQSFATTGNIGAGGAAPRHRTDRPFARGFPCLHLVCKNKCEPSTYQSSRRASRPACATRNTGALVRGDERLLWPSRRPSRASSSHSHRPRLLDHVERPKRSAPGLRSRERWRCRRTSASSLVTSRPVSPFAREVPRATGRPSRTSPSPSRRRVGAARASRSRRRCGRRARRGSLRDKARGARQPRQDGPGPARPSTSATLTYGTRHPAEHR